MQQLILNRDANRDGKNVKLTIWMPLSTTDDTVVEEHVTNESGDTTVSINSGTLVVSVTGKLNKGGYSKLLAKVYHDKELKRSLKQYAEIWDKSRSADLFLYNQFRLMWVGMCLDDDQLCSWTVFPIDIGANTLDESLANMKLISTIKVNIDKEAQKKFAGKAVANGFMGWSIYSLAAQTAAATGLASVTAAPIAAATSTVSAAAAAVVTAPVIIVAVPLAVVGGAMVANKALLSAEEKKLEKLVEICFALVAQVHTLNYCNKNELTGITMWRELSNLASVFGSKNLLELDEQIKDLT